MQQLGVGLGDVLEVLVARREGGEIRRGQQRLPVIRLTMLVDGPQAAARQHLLAREAGLGLGESGLGRLQLLLGAIEPELRVFELDAGALQLLLQVRELIDRLVLLAPEGLDPLARGFQALVDLVQAILVGLDRIGRTGFSPRRALQREERRGSKRASDQLVRGR
ncbi:hypothetical protein D3C86_1380870 [compost metagenome]